VELLEQAENLCRSAHLVAATVIAGGALETQLLHLCERNVIQWSGDGSISKYNDAISAARNAGTVEVYSATRAKDLTAWGGRRNDAAHRPTEYQADRRVVELMIEGVRSFVRETSPGA
jgi:hypothetical protein